MKRIMIIFLLLLFCLSACTPLEQAPADDLSQDSSEPQSHQTEEASRYGAEDMQDAESQADQSQAIQVENIQVAELPLIEELANLHSDREGFPYMEVTGVYGDTIFFTKGAIPGGSIYGTVDGSYQYNLNTDELVADIENEPTKRVMKIVVRDQIRYILTIDVENSEFTLVKEELSSGQEELLFQDSVLDPYSHSPNLLDKGENIYFIYPYRSQDRSYLRIFNLARDEREPIFEEQFRINAFDPEEGAAEDLGGTIQDTSDCSYLFLSYPENNEESQPRCFLNIIDGDQHQKIASEVPLEKAFISGDSLLLVLQRSIEEAMRDEPQEIVGLNLKEILQDETPYIRLADIESRIQTISYDVYYPKPIGNGAYLAFIPSNQKDALSLIQINEQQELEISTVHEFDRIGKFIALNEHECLLHFPTYKEDHSRNILYRISWR